MTIDIKVYCKKKPDHSNYVVRFELDRESCEDKGVIRLRSAGSGDHGFIARFPTTDAHVYQESHDREIIEEIFGEADAQGLDIPDDLRGKLTRDSIVNPGDPFNRLVVESNGQGSIEEVTDTYNLIADAEMYDIVKRYPYLEDVDPWLKQIFGIAKYSKGSPLYTAEICASQLTQIGTKKAMVNLAVTIANDTDGFIYEDQTNEFGSPDPLWLHSNGSGLIAQALRELNENPNIICSPTNIKHNNLHDRLGDN